MLACLISYLFWADIRLFFTLPKVVSIQRLSVAVAVMYLLSSVLRRGKIAIFGGYYYKTNEKKNQILDSKSGIGYDYFDSAVRGTVIEEIVFRIGPYTVIYLFSFVFGANVQTIVSQVVSMGATSLWVALHGDRIVQMIPQGILFYLLLTNGMIIESFVIHLLYNSISFASILLNSRIEGDS